MATRSNIMLSKAVKEYLDLQRARLGEGEGHRGHATVEADNNVLRMFLRISGDRQAMGVTAEHVEKFFYGKGGLRREHTSMSRRTRTETAPPVAAATHNHYRSRLKTFVAWCVSKGYMTPGLEALAFDKRNGAVKPLKVQKHMRQRPTPQALLSLLDATDNARDRAYLAVAVNTALRSNEISKLRVGSVNLDARRLYVVISKTKDADEQPITEELDQELRVWLTTYATDLGRPLREDDYLFPRRRGGLISHYDEDRQPVRGPYVWVPNDYVGSTHLIVQKALRKIGLPTAKEGTHTIRRAVALAYFQEVAREMGDVAALRETAAFLHHSSTATTELYLGMTPEKNRRDERLSGKPFLSAMISKENVVQLRSVSEGE